MIRENLQQKECQTNNSLSLQEFGAIKLDFTNIIDFSNDDRLFDLCANNRNLRIERTKEGQLSIMLPVGGEGSSREAILTTLIGMWNRKYKLGKVFSPTGGFILPNGAMRSPDVSFVMIDRWKSIPLLKRKKFLPICPDFVVELRSETDNLEDLKAKMLEWMENGCRLGWLIDPLEEKAYIYHPNRDPQTISSFEEILSDEKVLPNFQLNLSELREEE